MGRGANHHTGHADTTERSDHMTTMTSTAALAQDSTANTTYWIEGMQKDQEALGSALAFADACTSPRREDIGQENEVVDRYEDVYDHWEKQSPSLRRPLLGQWRNGQPLHSQARSALIPRHTPRAFPRQPAPITSAEGGPPSTGPRRGSMPCIWVASRDRQCPHRARERSCLHCFHELRIE